MASRSIKHLSRLSRRPIRSSDIVVALDAAKSLPDQAIALTSAALVERSLERAILARMRKLNRSPQRELFEGMGALATFSAKIRLAHALAIIGTPTKLELERVKNIRNQFAHSFHVINFRTKLISAECKKLITPERAVGMGVSPNRINPWPPRDPKVRYNVTCWLLWIALGGRKVNGPRPRKPSGRFARALLS